MTWIKEISRAYGVTPQKIDQISTSLYRIEDDKNVYALKRSQLSYSSLSSWENTYRQADSLQLTSIVPVYLNQSKKLYYESDNNIFYFSPWIDGKPVNLSAFYQCVGQIHARTKQKQQLDSENRTIEFEHYQTYCQEVKKKLLGYVEQFESHLFMSPFELQVCMNYRDIKLILDKLSKRLEQFIRFLTEEPKWSTSLCHGNLALSHSLANSQTVLINWERSFVGNASLDLANFFNYEIGVYDPSVKSYITSFSNYMNENKLEQSELSLLLIHIMNPLPYMTIVEEYLTEKPRKSIISNIRKLQHTYRRLIFALDFSDFIEKEYEYIFDEDLVD